MTLFVTVAASIFVALLAAGVALWTKRLDRINAAQARHSEAREAAYDRLLAAGDAAWYYRTVKGVDPDAEETDTASVGPAINDLFNSGLDQLVEHSRNVEAIGPAVSNWYVFALQHQQSGPSEFENARDAIVNLKRQEVGLRKNINRVRNLSFYDRLMTGHVVQRLPEGINQVLYMEDGGFMVTGAGGEFDQFFHDFINRPNELRSSRETARRRLAEWREKGVWKLPPTEREIPDLDA